MTSAMKPLTLTAEMALTAILGPKTETRRPLNPQPDWLPEVRHTRLDGMIWPIGAMGQQCGMALPLSRLPFGLPGEECWLREPGRVAARTQQYDAPGLFDIQFAAGGVKHRVGLPDRLLRGGQPPSWWVAGHGIPNGIFREAARWKTTILEVRVERLQEITEAGARAEGFKSREAFICTWNHIYGKRPGLAFADNPWVSVTKWDRMVAI